MVNYVYIMSHSYSGSTLLSMLLGAHPEIATIGEMGIAPGTDLDGYLCSCGEPIEACRFWAEVSERMGSRGEPFDIRHADVRFRSGTGPVSDRLLRAGTRGPLAESLRALALRVLPGPRRELRRLLRRNEALVRVVTEMTGRRTFVDISKRPGRLLHLRRIPEFEISVVHLVRDPRAVASSCIRNLAMDVRAGARSWLDFHRQAARTLRYFPPRSRTVLLYEDLCRKPALSLGRLHEAIGVSPIPEVPDFRAVEQHVIGNRMRLEAAPDIRVDERWKTSLSAAQVRLVDRIAGDAMRRLGYLPGK